MPFWQRTLKKVFSFLISSSFLFNPNPAVGVDLRMSTSLEAGCWLCSETVLIIKTVGNIYLFMTFIAQNGYLANNCWHILIFLYQSVQQTWAGFRPLNRMTTKIMKTVIILNPECWSGNVLVLTESDTDVSDMMVTADWCHDVMLI